MSEVTSTIENCVIVIFGASGDLTSRKLIPALEHLHRRNLLSECFEIVGVGRTELSDQEFRDRQNDGLEPKFLSRLHYQALDTGSIEAYGTLLKRLSAINCGDNYLFYLSTPPSLFGVITAGLRRVGLNRADREGGGWRRIVVEKPFGYNLESAVALDRQLHDSFEEHQIYRIDHYLGKETVQNMLVLRFGNGIFEPLWNRNYVDRVEITAAESIGVEGRGGADTTNTPAR